MTRVALPKLRAGDPEWQTLMTASKIAAVIGLSPYESRFSLWHQMAGRVERKQTDAHRRGHYLEPAICNWFHDGHLDQFPAMVSGGSWSNTDHPWMGASPDRLLLDSNGETAALLEAKSDADHTDEWGKEGTDQIPACYRAQVMWQMDVLGVHTCHVAMIGAYLTFKAYVVHYDPDEAAYLRDEGRKFLDTLPGGPNERRPDLDASTVTYETVRQLHPDIEPADVELPRDVAVEFCQARRQLGDAQDAATLAGTRIADLLGNAQHATYAGQKLASRRAKAGGTPYLTTARHLPDLEPVS